VSKHTILIVEDEEDIQQLVSYNFLKAGFLVSCAESGEEALELIKRELPDVIILDLMLPGMDGFAVCNAIKAMPEAKSTAIIMLTAKSEENNITSGLDLGADDYITKPFSPRELVARVRALLRRTGQDSPTGKIFRVGDLMLDLESYIVKVQDQRVDLTRSEFDLLAALLSAPGRVFTRLELLDRVQGTVFEGYERTIDVHIKNLRGKIEENPRKPCYIETVYGVGYRLALEES